MGAAAKAGGRAKKRTGTVVWYDRVGGFGFVRTEGERDVFVRESAICVPGVRTLRAGEPVEFEIVRAQGRREARRLVPVQQRDA